MEIIKGVDGRPTQPTALERLRQESIETAGDNAQQASLGIDIPPAVSVAFSETLSPDPELEIQITNQLAEFGIVSVRLDSAVYHVLNYGASVLRDGVDKAGELWRQANQRTGGKLNRVVLPVGAVVALIATTAACGQQPQPIGGGPTVNPTQVEQLKTIPAPTATAEAQKSSPTSDPEQEKLAQTLIAEIGEPTGYRPASKSETYLYDETRPNYLVRPAIKKDSQGKLLIPTYDDPTTILGKLDRFNPENYYPETLMGWIEPKIAQWMAQIEQALLQIRSRDFGKAKQTLLNDVLWNGIGRASESDDAWFRNDPKKFPSKPDKNGDGISDWFDAVYTQIKSLMGRLV